MPVMQLRCIRPTDTTSDLATPHRAPGKQASVALGVSG